MEMQINVNTKIIYMDSAVPVMRAIEKAVSQVLKDGYRTIDIMSEGKEQVGTAKIGDLICERIA